MKKVILFCGVWMAVATALKPELKVHLKAQHPKLKGLSAGTCFAIDCGEVDGPCNEESTKCPENTYCIDSTCRMSKDGDDCIENMCYNSNLFCNLTEEKCRKNLEIGDACTQTYPKCPTGAYCSPTENVCKATIVEEDAECDASESCDSSKGLYCDTIISKKCKKLPGKGEACSYGYLCAQGFTCNNSVCSDLPDVGETCNILLGCRGNYECSYNLNKCVRKLGEKGDPCDDDEVYCKSGLVCDMGNKVCKEYDGTCYVSNECPNFPENICFKSKCIKAFSLKEGEECLPVDFSGGIPGHDYYTSMFGCEEDYACVPDSDIEVGKCTKVTTKASDKKECSADSDCAADAYCTCSYEDGKDVCIPYPYSDKEIYNEYKSIIEKYYECVNKGDNECVEEITKKQFDLSYKTQKKFTPFDSEVICYEGAATPLTVSIFAMVLALLFALNF